MIEVYSPSGIWHVFLYSINTNIYHFYDRSTGNMGKYHQIDIYIYQCGYSDCISTETDRRICQVRLTSDLEATTKYVEKHTFFNSCVQTDNQSPVALLILLVYTISCYSAVFQTIHVSSIEQNMDLPT